MASPQQDPSPLKMRLLWLRNLPRRVYSLLTNYRKPTITQDNSVPDNVRSGAGTTVAVVESPQPSKSPLFALIIGINKYKDKKKNLRGAVADADAVRDFLITKLNVAKKRIVNLRNKEATRKAIVDAIQNLAHNPAIGKEDPILIYYAGHGSEAQPPANWITNNANRMIQMICPYDFDSKGSKDHRGQGLFDLTLSELLTYIAECKSDNITVIFDSCHSGSGTRLPDDTFAERCIELPSKYTTPANVFGFNARGVPAVPPGDEKVGLNSHVLLAACKKGQTAREKATGGVFTAALLNFLQTNLNSIDTLTYTDVVMQMSKLPNLNQNPQCEGVNCDRVLFKSKVTSPYRVIYPIYGPTAPGEGYILEAGEQHGVTKGAEFEVYPDQKMTPGSRIGSVVAHITNSFDTQCSPIDISATFLPSQPAFAVQTRVGKGQDLRLYIDPTDESFDRFAALAEKMQCDDPNRRSFRLLDNDPDKADLAISTHDGLVEFHVKDNICVKHCLTRMPVDDVRVNDTDYLISVLRSAADFYWNFHHSSNDAMLAHYITVECFKLVPSGKLTAAFREALVPDLNGKNLVNPDGTIIIDVEEQAKYGNRYQPVKYGYKITNNSDAALYAAVFYFDISGLSIDRYYEPGKAANGQADISLPPRGSLTIGFYDSGEKPQNYRLRDKQNVDVGFVKVYISTNYVYYTSIAQVSPFDQDRYTYDAKEDPACFWDAFTIPIVQRKGKGGCEGPGTGGADVKIATSH